MFFEHYAVSRSIKEAARYLDACEELGDALIDDGSDIARFDWSWEPSDDYRRAALSLYLKLSSEISEALDQFKNGAGDEDSEPLSWAQQAAFDAWIAARSASLTAQLLKGGWAHRVICVITEIIRRGNGMGSWGDFEQIWIASIVADHLGVDRRHVLANPPARSSDAS